MTLKEIAKEAGVSISTVSRVLNQPNTKAASAQVQERIWNIVRKNRVCPQSSRTRAPACFTAHPGYAVYLRINCLFPRGGTG